MNPLDIGIFSTRAQKFSSNFFFGDLSIDDYIILLGSYYLFLSSMEVASEPLMKSTTHSNNAISQEEMKTNNNNNATEYEEEVEKIEIEKSSGDNKVTTISSNASVINKATKDKHSLASSLLGSNLNSPARPPSFEARSLLLPTSTSIKSLSSAAGSSTAISGTGVEADGNSTEADIRSTNSSLRSSPRSPSLRHLLGPSSAVLASAHLRRSPTLPPAPPSFSMFQGRARLVTDASPFDPVGGTTGPSMASASVSTINHTPVMSRSAADIGSSAPGPFPSSLAARPNNNSSNNISASSSAVSSTHVVVTK